MMRRAVSDAKAARALNELHIDVMKLTRAEVEQ